KAEDGIRDDLVTGVQTCALPICEVQLAGSVQLGVAGADRERRVLVAGWPRRAREILVPVPAGEGAHRCPRGPDVARREHLEQGGHHGLYVFEMLAIGSQVETESVVQPPAALEVHRDDDAGAVRHFCARTRNPLGAVLRLFRSANCAGARNSRFDSTRSGNSTGTGENAVVTRSNMVCSRFPCAETRTEE